MAGIKNNLYPPIVASWMPAFVRTAGCKVYFSLSNYNSAEDIRNVQVTISYQNSNLSALNSTNYPAGIMITRLYEDSTIEGDAKYYVLIQPEDLQGGEFELGEYYKVQLRFTSTSAAILTDTKKIASWLVNNQSYFSEWSTICLIKGIQQPEIYIKAFDNFDDSASSTVYSADIIDLVGQMYFSENEDLEDETLKSYQIVVYNGGNEVFSSDEIYTNEYNPNEINYTLEYALEDGVEYIILLNYCTYNGYENSKSYTFITVQGGASSFNATITAEPEESNGRMKINVASSDGEAFLGNLIIRRSASTNNFTTWEDVKIEVIASNNALDYTWYDYTIESGVWYKYAAQKKDTKGNRSSAIIIDKLVMAEFDSAFLVNAEMQLNIRYDANISSFKTTLSESKTDTIGSQYPHFRRNGNIKYRQFPISGLVTSFCDEEGIFISKDILYGDNRKYYDNYNEENDIDEYQDYIYERKFREKVMEFLYNGTVKLFKSNTEGNILIRLMDINFTPNATLGRMLYSFSATAYEIDECSLANYEKYNIQIVGDWSSYIEYSYTKVGQLQVTVSANQDILTQISKKYANEVTNNFVIEVSSLPYIKLQFESDPYLIQTSGNSIAPLPAGSVADEDTVYGYIAYINGTPIIISKRGYYELNDDDIQITSLSFPVETTITLDYTVGLIQSENTSIIASKIYYYTKVGQVFGSFEIDDSVYKQIYLKYYENYKDYYQKIISLNQLSIEAVPGTVVYVKDSFDDTYYRHIVGATGVLSLRDENTSISQLYFHGIHLIKNTYDREAKIDEYTDTGISIENLSDVTNPINNGVYTLSSSIVESNGLQGNTLLLSKSSVDEDYRLLINQVIKRYIYYNNQWYVFSDENDVICPIEAMVDYIYEIIRGEY